MYIVFTITITRHVPVRPHKTMLWVATKITIASRSHTYNLRRIKVVIIASVSQLNHCNLCNPYKGDPYRQGGPPASWSIPTNKGWRSGKVSQSGARLLCNIDVFSIVIHSEDDRIWLCDQTRKLRRKDIVPIGANKMNNGRHHGAVRLSALGNPKRERVNYYYICWISLLPLSSFF